MRGRVERDLGNLIRGGAPVNARHKDRLRKRLFEETEPLSPDDLEGVTGGTALPEAESWIPWDATEDELKINRQNIF